MTTSRHSEGRDGNLSGAVQILLAAHRDRVLPDALPADLAPQDVARAQAIQRGLVEALREPVAGWKISLMGELMRGPILRSRLHQSPARLPSEGLAPCGVEAEIAFRFERALAPREEPYTFADLAANAVALPVIEVVSSRFAAPTTAPLLDRLADLFSNGALVTGEPVTDWTGLNFARLPVRLLQNDAVLIEREGGHPQSDPCGWALALVNELRGAEGVPAGLVVTTGSCTGIVYGAPGDRFRAEFSGFAPVLVQFA